MVDLEGRPLLQQAALVQHDDLAAHDQRLLRLGRRIDHRGRAGAKELLQLGPQLLPELVVEIDQGLVEEQKARLLDEGSRDGATLLLAA